MVADRHERFCVLYIVTGAAGRQYGSVRFPSDEAGYTDDGEAVIVVDNIYIPSANW
jgi:hypothetical protein